MPKRDRKDLARLLSTKAASDESILEKLLGDAEVPDDVLGFHAQQAVEKRIKSVLAHLDIPYERTHNIIYLLTLLEDRGAAPPPNAEELHALTPWATEFRYEDVLGRSIDREGVRELIRAVRRWAEQEMGD